MTLISTTLPTIGEANASADPDVRNSLQSIINVVNGQLDSTNLTPGGVLAASLADAARLGLTDGGTVRRGKVHNDAGDSTSSTSFVQLGTPDRVQNVVLPTDGLIVVLYQAIAVASVSNAAICAIFLGANQLTVPASGLGAPAQQSGQGGHPGGATFGTTATGLNGWATATGSTEVTTGEIAGGSVGVGSAGPCYIFAAAGAYDVSVQWRVTSGNVTVSKRHLWVWTVGF